MCPRARSSPARTSAASSRTRRRRWRSCGPGCSRAPRRSARHASRPRATPRSGVLVTAGALAPAAIAEALLGLVLVAGLLGWLSPRVAYGIALAGTLFGLSIVVARGLLGVDLWIHILMLVGLALAFALIFVRRTA